jgi:hypothetical protein
LRTVLGLFACIRDALVESDIQALEAMPHKIRVLLVKAQEIEHATHDARMNAAAVLGKPPEDLSLSGLATAAREAGEHSLADSLVSVGEECSKLLLDVRSVQVTNAACARQKLAYCRLLLGALARESCYTPQGSVTPPRLSILNTRA